MEVHLLLEIGAVNLTGSVLRVLAQNGGYNPKSVLSTAMWKKTSTRRQCAV